MVYNTKRFGLWKRGYLSALVASGSTLLNGLVSWWDLDEESGTRVDAMGAYDLTDNNTVGYGPGKIGNSAYLINANTEYLSNASGPSAASAPLGYTISLWFKPLASANQYAHHGDYASGRDTYLYIRSFDYVQFRYISSADATASSPASSVNIGEWNHAVGWWDPADGKSRVQVNGGTVGVSSSSSSQIESAISTFELGISISTTTDYIDLAGVWNRVLTADERTELYNAGASIRNDFSDNGEGFREGLVSYWKMEEESGTRVDSVGSNNLTDNNTVGYIAGKNGNAANFVDGNTEYLSIAHDDSLSLLDGFTINMWVKRDRDDDYEGLVEKLDGDGGYRIRINTGEAGTVSCFVHNGVGSFTMTSNNVTFTPNVWHMITFAYDVRSGTAYFKAGVDADMENEAAVGGNMTANTRALDLGRYPPFYLDGGMDEVMFYNRYLTNDEITALYAAGAGRFYDFQE